MAAKSLSAVVAGGDRLKSLQALRDRLAVELDTCESKRDTASLSQRLMDVLEQIETVKAAQPEKKGTARDEVARKRRERQAAAKGSGRTASG